ncbi:hypothetical protein C8R46DRAFT_1030659 [Mycena filopes]|nr:hypothetical protein C8R46DRAFT_1030659 [Mycena filopes]
MLHQHFRDARQPQGIPLWFISCSKPPFKPLADHRPQTLFPTHHLPPFDELCNFDIFEPRAEAYERPPLYHHPPSEHGVTLGPYYEGQGPWMDAYERPILYDRGAPGTEHRDGRGPYPFFTPASSSSSGLNQNNEPFFTGAPLFPGASLFPGAPYASQAKNTDDILLRLLRLQESVTVNGTAQSAQNREIISRLSDLQSGSGNLSRSLGRSRSVRELPTRTPIAGSSGSLPTVKECLDALLNVPGELAQLQGTVREMQALWASLSESTRLTGMSPTGAVIGHGSPQLTSTEDSEVPVAQNSMDSAVRWAGNHPVSPLEEQDPTAVSPFSALSRDTSDANGGGVLAEEITQLAANPCLPDPRSPSGDSGGNEISTAGIPPPRPRKHRAPSTKSCTSPPRRSRRLSAALPTNIDAAIGVNSRAVCS